MMSTTQSQIGYNRSLMMLVHCIV